MSNTSATPHDRRWRNLRRASNSKAGAILLEVIFALGLFVAAASVVVSGLNTSMNATERLRREVIGANLAVTILSEVQMGMVPLASAGPESFATPFADWSWEVLVEDPERGVVGGGGAVGGNLADGATGPGAQMKTLEVIVRHEASRLTQRLTQLVREMPAGALDRESGEDSVDDRAEEEPDTQAIERVRKWFSE